MSNALPEKSTEELYVIGKQFYDDEEYEEALPYFRKSAKQGYAFAQYNLGLMYDTGRGVKQNYKKAVKWYRKSAKQGNEQAIEALKTLGER